MAAPAAFENVEQALSAREGFTSESFKIEIQGLPKFFGIGQAKKLFKKNALNFHKLKPAGKNATYMFVNFKNEEDREKAIAKLDGLNLRGRNLKVIKAKAVKDPMLKRKEKPIEDDSRTVYEKLCSAVCPLAHLPYDEQISTKSGIIQELMSNLKQDILKNLSFIPNKAALKTNEILLMNNFVKSPVLNGYRNKCEFSIGYHPETGKIAVGFRLASYKKGSVAVAGVSDLPIVSDKMKQVCQHFESFVQDSKYAPFDSVSQTGHWKQLTVRTNRNDDCLVWIILNLGNLSESEMDGIRSNVREHMKSLGFVTSLHIQFFHRKEKGQEESPVEMLYGSPVITEKLFNLDFEISPQAFFQINTLGAELLYENIGSICDISEESSTVLDVCCGTGTIALCLASKAKEVIGVEIVEQAVEDAKKNAERNNVNNVEFIAGKAEFVLSDIFRRKKSVSDIIAVVDPPRAGLHPKAIQAIRSSDLSRLVFVSCDAKAAMNNFVNLARPPSNAFPGDPFIPRRVIPVDLFPHTNHFELIILFERVSMSELLKQS